jgi:hypothetical protein
MNTIFLLKKPNMKISPRYVSLCAALLISFMVSGTLMYVAIQHAHAASPFDGTGGSGTGGGTGTGGSGTGGGTGTGGSGTGGGTGTGGSGTGGGTGTGGSGTGTADFNPLKGIGNICQLIDVLLNIVIQVGAIIGVIFIIYSGFLFLKAQGNSKEITNAKNTLFTTLIGLAILLGSSVIAKIILTTISNVIGGEQGSCLK